MMEILANPTLWFEGHALQLCPSVLVLLRRAFFETANPKAVTRLALLHVLDGVKLARVRGLRNRLPTMHRAGWDGNKADPCIAYGWFIWDAAHNGPTELRRTWWEGASRGAERRSLPARERPGGEYGPGSGRGGAT